MKRFFPETKCSCSVDFQEHVIGLADVNLFLLQGLERKRGIFATQKGDVWQ